MSKHSVPACKQTLRAAKTPVALAVAAICSLVPALVGAQEKQQAPKEPVEHIVITSEQMVSPSVVVTDPKQPRQPLPANDAADFLKTIPGFNVIRKGGVSGDPTFRSMAASRLTIMSDDSLVLGGCNSRMDPPTAYITPHNYDVIRVIKGPQSVLYLPAQATVLFERENYRLTETTLRGQLGMTWARFGRFDSELDVTAGTTTGYARVTANHAQGNDYKDGDDHAINSDYKRWSYQTELAWTPTDDTSVIASFGRSDGEAAYADRSMDGALFDRISKGLKVRHDDLTTWLKRLEFSVTDTYVDHVMDNYSLRDFSPSMMMPNPSAMNPDRDTQTYRLTGELSWAPTWLAVVGLDASDNQHSNRMTMNQPLTPYQAKPRLPDADFAQQGLFVEVTYQPNAAMRLHAGLRQDRWQTEDLRAMLMKTMQQKVVNPTFGATRDERLHSGFVRAEVQQQAHTLYMGLGHAERFPDYWELIGKARGSETSASAFFTDIERTDQLDLGWLYRSGQLNAELALYFGAIDNFILLEQQSMMGPETVRNIDAQIWGGEASLGYQWTEQLHLQATLAVSRGSNITDARDLAQQAPTELRFAADYEWHDWRLGALWRLVDGQDRFAPKQGTIVGLDSTATAGFGVLSINAQRQLSQGWTLHLGIDNLLDKTYQEHLSRQASAIPGYVASERVNEPGRVAWARATYSF